MTSKYGFSTDDRDRARQEADAAWERSQAESAARAREEAAKEALRLAAAERASEAERKAKDVQADFAASQLARPFTYVGYPVQVESPASDQPDVPLKLIVTVHMDEWLEIAPEERSKFIGVLKEQTGIEEVSIEEHIPHTVGNEDRPKGPMSRGR